MTSPTCGVRRRRRAISPWFSLGLMAAGQLVAVRAAAPATRLAYALCFVLSVLYSVPPFRLKAVAGADWLINMWGFGTLTPYAGWAATGLPLDGAALARAARLLSRSSPRSIR